MTTYFVGYFHVEETQGVHRSLGHIHDTFKRLLLKDLQVFVGWEEDRTSGIRYSFRIESKYDDSARITEAFREITVSFDPYLRLATLMRRQGKYGFKLVDLFEPENNIAIEVNC